MTTINNKLANLRSYILHGYIWLFFLRPLLSDPYEHVRDEVKRKCDVIWHQTRLLDLDKVSLKLSSKNLGGL